MIRREVEEERTGRLSSTTAFTNPTTAYTNPTTAFNTPTAYDHDFNGCDNNNENDQRFKNGFHANLLLRNDNNNIDFGAGGKGAGRIKSGGAHAASSSGGDDVTGAPSGGATVKSAAPPRIVDSLLLTKLSLLQNTEKTNKRF